jgi:hypothetical protein
MDMTLWVVVAVVIVIALVVYRYRREIVLRLKGFGVDAEVRAKDHEKKAATEPPERGVRIGGSARDNRIVTGDAAPRIRRGATGGTAWRSAAMLEATPS